MRVGCNSSAEHADNEGYVLPSGVVCFTSSSLIYQTDSKNRPSVLSMEFSFLFLFLSFFFLFKFSPSTLKNIYYIFQRSRWEFYLHPFVYFSFKFFF